MMGQDGNLDHPHRTTEEGPEMKVKTLGIDLAKDVFGVHGVDARGKALMHRRVSRKQLLGLLAKLEPCLVGMEACGSAHHWAREIEKLGHTVRLMSPQFVKPYRKGNKNDPNDAEAICEAVSRPSMRFVPIKSAAQQDLQALHRVREQLLKSRTALVNQVRGLLGEHGIIAPRGIAHLRRLLNEVLADPEGSGLSGLLSEALVDFRTPALLRPTHPGLRRADRASVCARRALSATGQGRRSRTIGGYRDGGRGGQCTRIQEREGTLGLAGVGAASAFQRQS
jgi:transposase